MQKVNYQDSTCKVDLVLRGVSDLAWFILYRERRQGLRNVQFYDWGAHHAKVRKDSCIFENYPWIQLSPAIANAEGA